MEKPELRRLDLKKALKDIPDLNDKDKKEHEVKECLLVLTAIEKHDSDKELMGQGLANIAMPFFGAMPATAAVARSAINFREGAKTRFAGVIHALILLLILLLIRLFSN